MTIDGAGEKRPILGIKGPVPSTQLTDTIRVPSREEVDRLSVMLSNADRTVEIIFIPKFFHARLSGAKHDELSYLPPGYMVNIHTRHPRIGFWTEDANNTKEAVAEVCSTLGIEDPSINAVIYTHKGIEPHQGAFINPQTMQQLCAVAAKQGQER